MSQALRRSAISRHWLSRIRRQCGLCACSKWVVIITSFIEANCTSHRLLWKHSKLGQGDPPPFWKKYSNLGLNSNRHQIIKCKPVAQMLECKASSPYKSNSLSVSWQCDSACFSFFFLTASSYSVHLSFARCPIHISQAFGLHFQPALWSDSPPLLEDVVLLWEDGFFGANQKPRALAQPRHRHLRFGQAQAVHFRENEFRDSGNSQHWGSAASSKVLRNSFQYRSSISSHSCSLHGKTVAFSSLKSSG